MSDDTIFKMAQQVGEMQGTLNSFIVSQKAINDRQTTLLENQDKRDDSLDTRIQSLEGTRKMVYGFAAAIGSVSGGLAAKFAAILGHG